MYKILTSLIILGSIAFSGWMYPQIQQVKETQNEISFGAKNAVGGEVYYLSGSGLTSSATSIGLTKFGYTQPGGTYSKFSMPNFGDLGCATIQPGNTSGKQEFISFTGVSQNSDGTATLTGVTRGLERYTPFAASTTLQTAHAGGSDIVISNSPPCFYESYANLSQDEAVTGLWNFNSYLPTSSITATTSAQFTTKSYVDNLTNQGAATSTLTNGGIVELATQQEMASSTDSGDVEKPRVLWSAYATSSPYTAGMWAPITDKDGKLNQTFWRLTDAFTPTGLWTFNTLGVVFNASTTFNTATSTFNSTLATFGDVFMATSSIKSLNVTTLNATSTSATSTINMLEVKTRCKNCVSGTQIVNASAGGPTTNTGHASVSVDCPSDKKLVGGGASDTETDSNVAVADSYPADSNTWTATYVCAGASCDANTMTVYAICVDN